MSTRKYIANREAHLEAEFGIPPDDDAYLTAIVTYLGTSTWRFTAPLLGYYAFLLLTGLACVATIDGFVATTLTLLAVFVAAYAVLNLLVYDRAVLTLSRDHDRLVLAVLTPFRFRVRRIIIDEAPSAAPPALVKVRLLPSHRFYRFDRPDQAPVYVRMGRGYSSAIENFLRPRLG